MAKKNRSRISEVIIIVFFCLAIVIARLQNLRWSENWVVEKVIGCLNSLESDEPEVKKLSPVWHEKTVFIRQVCLPYLYAFFIKYIFCFFCLTMAQYFPLHFPRLYPRTKNLCSWFERFTMRNNPWLHHVRLLFLSSNGSLQWIEIFAPIFAIEGIYVDCE